MRAGKIADPFFGLNHLDCRWMEEKEWWYRREFVVPESLKGKRVELRFGGLDCFATVWLNGKPVGAHANMFVATSFDVTDLLSYGRQNLLAVRFSSPLKAVEGKTTEGMVCAFETRERLYARKAQMSYGWDIAPRIVTTGIWRPVYLAGRGDLAIEDVAIRTRSIGCDEAIISFDITLRRNRSDIRSAELAITARNGKSSVETSVRVELTDDSQIVHTELTIPNPELWWPWNVGRPSLYSLHVEAGANGVVQETCSTRFGIRSIVLEQEPQEDGCRSFIFKVNSERVFAKGTNWIPGDAIFARMSRRKYRDLVDLALENGINMFRIWGGGIYEDPYFYRLCDERGIMVWQDFMFTCAEYPQDEEFLGQVRYEAEKVVTGLRNHPSIVLWCGDNEVDATIYWSGIGPKHNKISREVLPEVCARLDPTRPFLPSSPFSPYGDPNPMSRWEGDNHIWRHGASYKDPVYSEDTSRFVSEIGHLSAPWPESVRRFLPPESLWPPENQAWDFHFGTVELCDPRRRERLDEAILNFGFDRPDNLEGYAYLTQLIQALAYREWIEHCRRRKFLCGGILYWNLYDNWPQFSDAAVDYYQNPKMAYYFVSRAFANLLVSLKELYDGKIGVWLVNDELRDRAGKLLLRCQRFDGGTSWTRILPVKLPANSSRMVWDMRMPGPLIEDPSGCFAQAQLQIGGRVVSEAFHFPAEFKDIEWPQTRLSALILDVSRLGRRTRADVMISSSAYGRLVRLETGSAGVPPARFGDNFFDIPPAEERIVRVMAETDPGDRLTIRISAQNVREPVRLAV